MVFDPGAYQQKIAEYLAQMQAARPPGVARPGGYGAQVSSGSPGAPSGLGLGALVGMRVAAPKILAALSKPGVTGIGPVASGSEYAELLGATGGTPSAITGGVSGIGPIADGGAYAANIGEAAPTSISNFAGSATPYLGAAGTVAGAIGAYKGIKDKNPLGAALGGAGAGLGINAMGYALGPYGWAAMAAAPAIAALVNKLGDKDRWKEEQDAVGKLAKKGVTGWADYQKTLPKLTRGRSRDELIAIEQANIAAGKHGNLEFAQTRDKKFLKPKDIWGYSAFGKKYGNDWFGKFSEGQREGIAKIYLDAGAVEEGRGQIKLKTTPDLEAKIQAYLSGVTPMPRGGAPAASTRSKTTSPGIGKDGRRISYASKK